MDNLFKLLNIWEKGLDSPLDYILLVIGAVAVLPPLLINVYKIISYNDFDRLLIPKHERNVQQLLAKIFDYFFFSITYFITGLILLYLNNLKVIFLGIPGFIAIMYLIALVVFVISFVPILLKIIANQLIRQRQWKYLQKIKNLFEKKIFRYLFNLNLFSSFPVYAMFLVLLITENLIEKSQLVFSLLCFPIILLLSYRFYNQKYDVEYICQIISEKEFNENLPVLKYSLDKEKIVFSKASDASEKELYVVDRGNGKYYKFIKVEIL